MLKKTSSVEIIYFYRHYSNSTRRPQDHPEYVSRHPGHFKDIHTSTGCPEVILKISLRYYFRDIFEIVSGCPCGTASKGRLNILRIKYRNYCSVFRLWVIRNNLYIYIFDLFLKVMISLIFVSML